MIIEFIGSTGAGKTTLLNEVYRRLAQTENVITSVDLTTGLVGLRGVQNPTLQNLLQEVISFPFFVGRLPRDWGYLLRAVQLFTRNARFSLKMVNNLRSLERKMGVYAITQKYSRGRVILVDEGPILAAHMFAYTGGGLKPEEIAQFAGLIPMPDLVIYVRASVDTLVRRTFQRPDPPREMDLNNRAQIEMYARQAVALFDELVKAPAFQGSLLVVENRDGEAQGYDRVAEEIKALIRRSENA